MDDIQEDDVQHNLFTKKVWKYWAAYEGYDCEKIVFDSRGLLDDDLISFEEFYDRLISKGN